jgi:glycerol kinase
MPASLVQNESILAIDVGATSTRAVLFDVVEGQYRFVASGQAPSTAEAPFKDIGMVYVKPSPICKRSPAQPCWERTTTI